MADDSEGIKVTLLNIKHTYTRQATLTLNFVGGSMTCNVAISPDDRIVPVSKEDAEKLAVHFNTAASLFNLPEKGKKGKPNRNTKLLRKGK